MDARARLQAEPQDAGEAELSAKAQLEGFLCEFGFAAGPARDAQVERLLASCKAARPDAAADDLAAAALQHAAAEVEAWLRRALGEERLRDHSALLLGRVALRACAAARRWPDALFSGPPPEELIATIRAAAPEATPPEEPGIMAEQPLESWSITQIAPVQWLRRLLGATGRTSIAS